MKFNDIIDIVATDKMCLYSKMFTKCASHIAVIMQIIECD